MNSPRITSTPRHDASTEAELNAFAASCKRALNCHAKKKATHPGGPEDAERSSDDIRAKTILPQQP
jgi:hypothetical protein